MAKKAPKKKTKKTPATTSGRTPGAGALTLRLDAVFYPRATVDRAAQAFAHLASIRVRREGSQQVVEFSEVDPDVLARLEDEFTNYALSCAVVAT